VSEVDGEREVVSAAITPKRSFRQNFRLSEAP
jgi:hypothetical protein